MPTGGSTNSISSAGRDSAGPRGDSHVTEGSMSTKVAKSRNRGSRPGFLAPAFVRGVRPGVMPWISIGKLTLRCYRLGHEKTYSHSGFIVRYGER
jgi:hypothetical protein